jgi:hypothetical protein
MAVTYDSLSGAATGFGSSNTFPHTCSGTDRMLLAWVYGDRGDASSYGVSAMSYAGVALTQVGTWGDGIRWGECWRLVAPATGANNVVAAYNNGGGVCKQFVRCTSWNGVDQTTPLGDLASATADSVGPATVNVTSPGDLIVDCAAIATITLTLSMGADQTLIENTTSTGGSLGAVAMSTELANSDPGTVTMSWTLSARDYWLIGAVPIKASGGGVAGVPKTTKLALLGVG